MSQENVQIVKRGYRAFGGADPKAALADVAEDFVATRVAPMPDVTPYRGPHGLLRILSDWTAGFAAFEMSPEEFIDANADQVVVRLHQRAVGAHSGVPIEADFWFVHTMRDRKLVRMEIYASQSQALKAVGLAE
jgi:ketosteroid isomerase-like protein